MAARIETPLDREPVEIAARSMSAARRARIIARDKHCKHPACEVDTGLEIDHIIAIGLGGKDADWNLQALCVEHHKRKTAQDAWLIAKAKRAGLKHRGEFPPAKQKIRSRGFERRWNG